MIDKQKIYVAGPYSQGDTILNIKEAVAAADILLDYGFVPFVPHLTGFWHMLYPRDYDKWLAYDLEWLKSCHALLRLEGESKGADQEVAWAMENGIPVFTEISQITHHYMCEV